jgi:hypothetical protein
MAVVCATFAIGGCSAGTAREGALNSTSHASHLAPALAYARIPGHPGPVDSPARTSTQTDFPPRLRAARGPSLIRAQGNAGRPPADELTGAPAARGPASQVDDRAAYTTLVDTLNSRNQVVLNDISLTTAQRDQLLSTIAVALSSLQSLLSSTPSGATFAVHARDSTFALLARTLPLTEAAYATLTDSGRLAPLAGFLGGRILSAQQRGQPTGSSQANLQDFLAMTSDASARAAQVLSALSALRQIDAAAQAQLLTISPQLKTSWQELLQARVDYSAILAGTLVAPHVHSARAF